MPDLESKITESLDRWGLLAEPEALAVLDLAGRLDAEDLRPAAAAMLHAQLGARLSDLRKLAPVEATNDEVDELAAQREQRRKAAGL